MIKKEKPWFFCFDRWALFLFTLGAVTVHGANQLRILGGVLALSFIYKYIASNAKWKGLDHPPEVLSYTLWGLWTGLTGLLVCTSYEFFWQNYRVLLQMIVMIWAIYGLLRLRMSEKLVYYAIILGCVIQIVAVKLGYSFEKDIGIVVGEEQFGEERIAGLTGNANTLGFVMLAGFYCIMQVWRMKRSPINIVIKLMLIGLVAVSAYVTWQTGSRKTSSAMAVLIVGWSVWLLPQNKGINSLFLRVGSVIVLLIMGGIVVSFVSYETVVGKRFDQLLERGHGSIVVGVEEDIRFEMYQAGVRMFLEHPITGVGLGHFQLHFWRGLYSHSDYVEPLACTGLVGFLLYHSFNFFLLKRLLMLYRRVQNKDEKYKIGCMILVLSVHLLLGLGAPYWQTQRTFILMTTFVTYTWMLEKQYTEHTHLRNRLRRGPI